MDRNSPDFYCETTAGSLAETERFVSEMLADAESGAGGDAFNANGVCEPCAPRAPPAQPVITPRFVPTCSMELMKGLAQIAKRHSARGSPKPPCVHVPTATTNYYVRHPTPAPMRLA